MNISSKGIAILVFKLLQGLHIFSVAGCMNRKCRLQQVKSGSRHFNITPFDASIAVQTVLLCSGSE